MHKVDIIIINFKNWQDTIECLESIKKSDYPKIYINIIDVLNLNNSLVEIEKYLENYPFIVSITKINENKGFAFANNQILKKLLNFDQTEFIFLLNNDTVIKENTISSLVNFFNLKSQTEKVGIVGSKLLEYYNPYIIQALGGYFNPKKGKVIINGKNMPDKNKFEQKCIKVDFVTGAAMFFHKNILQDIGLMPQEYFLYYEDIDWCFTALKKGYKNFICENSVVLHKQGGVTENKYDKKKSASPFRKYMYSGYIKFYKKHFPKQSFIGYFWLLKQFIGRIIRLNFGESKFILSAIFRN